ncbi:carbamoyl-phosphate synthase subunit L [Roseateles sp. DAIF2]|uniref:acetyl/propionyl/methylcrotonyl-CoA carboxylase subunit alpha n=1 Tax=Roseateles sp. DAIF2 TaxID=2714952 RepID=UPI0018A27C74|nr:biotin carboxylase N-terminal domain-containing protein [Roseateles sp. DAIF2]QPF72476.1 carbamoyl-phosphate synthase subunit L [Roseateles sp. DAIF2]
MFDKILIANRGEIACRVIRTARALGYRTVAVYSDADARALHVREADEACRIGPAPAAQSYLDIDALIAAARCSGAGAVHPGYGFLSERADFARACEAAGLVFIGPSADCIAAMGDKARAKALMAAAGVPCLPGVEATPELAARLGFPLLVKALAGGGGRGMRIVRGAEELAAALDDARREAESAFGDGRLMLERLVARGRHVEVQVFGDAHGGLVHLGERDCTTQRRRQKLIEESPSPALDAAQREALLRDALRAARAVDDYRGAGTVEFIVDIDSGAHFFLEMNTRLQVEHPVTELRTGLDLVEWQLRVAAGEPLPLRQEQIRFEGHAIEARLCAEDPHAGFAPQTGRIARWRPQFAERPGLLRIDGGVAEGDAITPFYDPLLAKLIAHGRDRAEALRRLDAALLDAPLLGVVNNGPFLRGLLRHPDFRAGAWSTGVLDAGNWPAPRPDAPDWLAAAALLALGEPVDGPPRPAGLVQQDLTLACRGETRRWRVAVVGRQVRLEAPGEARSVEVLGPDEQGRERLLIEGHLIRRAVCRLGPATLQLAGEAGIYSFAEPALGRTAAADEGTDPGRARAPVAGLVSRLLVAPGEAVAEGQALLSLEAMKMETWITAGRAGRVRALFVGPRDAVAAGALLLELED